LLISMAGAFHPIRLWVLAGVAAAQLALADPAPSGPPTCPVARAQDAGTLADKLFDRREYQQAGACYQAAGDMVHANLAFLKAAGPRSEDTARDLKAQQEAAKSLFARVGNAFRSNH
jgi:hypothetical protein